MAARSPVIAGSVSGKLTPQVGRRFARTLYDVDTLNRPVFGLTSQVYDLLPPQYSQHPRYPGLYFIDYDETEGEGLTTTLNLHYMGCLNGVPPPPKPVDDIALMTTELFIELTNSADPGAVHGFFSIIIQLRCPTTVYSWFEVKKPGDEPRYKTVNTALNPWKNPVFSSRQQQNIATNAGTALVFAKITEALKDYTGGTIDTYQNFTKTPIIPDRLWQCSCTAIRQPDPMGGSIVIDNPIPPA